LRVAVLSLYEGRPESRLILDRPIATILLALHVSGSLPVFVEFAQNMAALFGQVPH
jgi:hypothetical protein